MSLKSKFNDIENRRLGRRAERVSQRLDELAEKIPQLAKHKLHNGAEFYEIKEMKYCNAKVLDGYRRLHEACAAADVLIEYDRIPWEKWGAQDCIFIGFSTPYSASTEASYFAKPSPAAPAETAPVEAPAVKAPMQRGLPAEVPKEILAAKRAIANRPKQENKP
jgi:hypothetical protein